MTTGLVAIETVSKATGILPATIGGAARSLRETMQDLWPQAAPGGGRNANHVRPHHLVNLALALGGCTVDPITTAPDQVMRYRNLQRMPLVHGPLWGVARPNTLGEYMELLVQQLSIPDRFTSAELDHYRHPVHGMDLTIRSNRAPTVPPYASLEMTHPGGLTEFEHFGIGHQEAEPNGPAIALHVTARIPFMLIELLGALWADTQAHEAKALAFSSPRLSLPGGILGTKNAALPGAALPKDRDHTSTIIPEATALEIRRERESTQASSKHGSGPSRNRAKDKPYAHPYPAAGPSS